MLPILLGSLPVSQQSDGFFLIIHPFHVMKLKWCWEGNTFYCYSICTVNSPFMEWEKWMERKRKREDGRKQHGGHDSGPSAAAGLSLPSTATASGGEALSSCPSSCLPYWICRHVNCYCLNQLIEMELFSESSIRPSLIMKCLWRAQLVNVMRLGDSAANNSVLGRRDSNSRSRCHLISKRRIGSCGPDITCLGRGGLIDKDSIGSTHLSLDLASHHNRNHDSKTRLNQWRVTWNSLCLVNPRVANQLRGGNENSCPLHDTKY